MFGSCKKIKNLDLSSFNTNKVTNMSSMLYECSSLKEINLSSFNTDKVTNMSGMFDEMPTFSKLICKDKKLIKIFNQKKNNCNIF